MGALMGLFVGLGVVVVGLLVVVARRRRSGPSEYAQGLLIEQQARREASRVRSEVRSLRAHAGMTATFAASRLTRGR
ncbi:hypothetical protein [Streptomyces melanogenes]|uniref:Secreted protein n=1 Tax=Streptomyces melanogenes TaxID=67326 RepID=A0ABZ1XZ82_9ACTN|nr:hypothetical protein [Streptomyces melanogenes]